ncbi:MAG: glycoside hydrolase family 43 protein [Clostridia bacterium]|nr:glycoside hydrolase family 43 protein [Clostridia bacterium]
MPYLCAHFRESLEISGEQVHFAVSPDGYRWETVNGGAPVLRSKMGCGGVRDIEILRRYDGGFSILATDLCIVKRMDEHHNVDWKDCNHNGSRYVAYWETDDLVHFSEQRLLFFGRDDFGCLWAPEVFCDDKSGQYLIHWGSTTRADGYEHMRIFYTLTKDFISFTRPAVFFEKPNELLDSHLVKIGDTYHLFYKNSDCPAANMHETAASLFGPFTHDDAFDARMRYYGSAGAYEAATTFILPDGRWCLFLDYFGCPKPEMGYVPYVSETPGNCDFRRADSEFSFPYGFKHGRVIEITEAEYERLKTASFD